MNRFLTRQAAFAATRTLTAALACGSASALTLDWGVHGPAVVAAAAPPPGFFDDVYAFLLNGSGTLGAVAVANNLNVAGNDVYLVVGGVFGLYRNPDGMVGNGDDAEVGAGLRSFDGESGDLVSVFDVQPGRYYYRVLGLAFGSAGGAYQLTSGFTATAVPEPGRVALMLAGLGVVGWVARLRRPADVADGRGALPMT